MIEPCVIGIDIGTGSVKAVAVNYTGEVISSAQRFYPYSKLPAGEQDPFVALTAFKECLKEIAANVQGSLSAISLSSAMHSMMAVDDQGKPLMNFWLWSDIRSAAVAKGLRNTDEGRAIYTATGTPVHAMSPLCKIRWLKENGKAIFAKVHKFISVKEFIWHQLFNEYKIDHSLASATGLFNIHSLQWEEKALAFACIGAGKLSGPVSTAYSQPGLPTALCKELNVPSGVPFFIGAGDGCLANLGSLCLDETSIAATVGTSAAVRITSRQPVVDADRMIFNYRLDEETFVCGGATNNGGNVIEWLKELFVYEQGVERIFPQIISSITNIPAGSEGLIFLPYLYGERAPVWDETSSGAFIGIKANHTKAHFMRAAVEGVCLALYDIFSSFENAQSVKEIKLSGGGGRTFAQVLADVTFKTVRIQTKGDSSATGAAFLALKALGVIADYHLLQPTVDPPVEPMAENFEIYRRLFSVYKGLYPALKESMQLLCQVS